MKGMMLKVVLTVLICTICTVHNHACTIFVLTDVNKTLFFNNEDYSNPATRIWFLPRTKEYYGVAYVGFDNDWAQGGVNTAGLAFDWVAGFEDNYQPDDKLIKLRGNPSERMLESCSTVSEAIAFYKRYKEPSFSSARIMIADKSGASVIIGAQNGRIYFDTSNQSRGFGYGKKALDEFLVNRPEPSFQSGLPILQACSQKGLYATKYSSVYDLRSGEIYLDIPDNPEAGIKINLQAELAKGAHYYDIPHLRKQFAERPLQLRPGMKRSFSDGYAPISNPDPSLDYRFRTFIEKSAAGTLKSEEFTPELWNQMFPKLKDIQEDSQKLGKMESFILVERKEINEQQSYLYLIEFENYTVLFRFVVDDKNKLTMIKSEAGRPK